MRASVQLECARPEAYSLPWTESTSKQLLVLSRLRTEGELPEMAGTQCVVKALLFIDLSLPMPLYARNPPIKVQET